MRVTPLDSRTNVAILQSAPSFAAAFANVVSDEEDNSAHDSDSSSASEGEEEIPHLAQRPRPITFEAGTTLDVIPPDTIMEEQQSPVQLFLYWHYRLNHLPYSQMVKMAKAGLIPKAIAKTRPPTCPSCRRGRAT